MDLVSSIQKSSRGKGKGVAWTVQLNLPAVVGNIDAKLYATIMASEIVDTIRAHWGRGMSLTGERQTLRAGQILLREMEAYIIRENPSYFEYQRKINGAALGNGTMGFDSDSREFRRTFRPKIINFERWKNNIKKSYQLRVTPDGEIGKKTAKAQYIPDPGRPALFGSGLMVDALRGKFRNARGASVNGHGIRIEQHVELRLPKSRQHTAEWAGGLNSFSVGKMTETFRYMPETKAAMENAVRWQQIGQVATNAFAMLRVARLAWRILA